MSTETEWDVVVVGAGAAGLMAASESAERGRRTLLLEKNRKPGVKILISGGTRCNLTHHTDVRGIVAAFGRQGRFLHSALAALSPEQLVEQIERWGVPTKVESTGKVFPVSDRALDVVQALMRRLTQSGAALALGEPLLSLERADTGFLLRTELRELRTERVLLTTGGQSYSGCGTTGDGYAWVQALGHALVPPRAALAPLLCEVPWARALQGVTMPDVELNVVARQGAPEPKDDRLPRRGSMLFTHFGFSGPAPMDVSRAVTARSDPRELALRCDFLPDVSAPALGERIRAEAGANGKRHVVTALLPELPRRLIETLAAQAEIPADRRGAELGREERERLVQLLKHAELPLVGTRGFAKAEVTAGGVPLDEVDSRTMQSKVCPGLYLAGELLDLDGPIGGYNFQAAFSTGTLAGRSI